MAKYKAPFDPYGTIIEVKTMAATTPDLTAAEPFKIVNRPNDPKTDPLRLEVTIHPSPNTTADETDLPHARWAVDLTESDEHVHPKWEERFEVIAGEYRVTSEGTVTTLTKGDDIVLSPNVPHRHWNPTDRPLRLRYEARPGLGGAEAFETLFTLAQMGRVGEDGLPNPLHFAVIQDTYPGLFYTTDLPRVVQRAMFTLLAPIGRRLGYRASHSKEEIADLR